MTISYVNRFWTCIRDFNMNYTLYSYHPIDGLFYIPLSLIDRGLLLSSKHINQGCLLMQLKSSIRKWIWSYQNLMTVLRNYVCTNCRFNNTVLLSSNDTYRIIRILTDFYLLKKCLVTCGAGYAYPTRNIRYNQRFIDGLVLLSIAKWLVFCVMFY